nr:DUF3080 family protein [Photobacterium toruni]
MPRYPRTHALKQPIADITIGLLNAYELRQCGLFQLIAERNSVLGKVQDKTRRLRYELLFLKQITPPTTMAVYMHAIIFRENCSTNFNK